MDETEKNPPPPADTPPPPRRRRKRRRSQATPDDVRDAYLMAYKLRCKGTTVYRYGSKPQVLYIGSVEKEAEVEHVRVDSEYSGGCPGVVCTF